MLRSHRTVCALLLTLGYCAATAPTRARGAERTADDAHYFYLAVHDLIPYAADGAFKVSEDRGDSDWRNRSLMRPYVTLEGPGEAYWQQTQGTINFQFAPTTMNEWGYIGVRLPKRGDFVGKLYFPNESYSAMRSVAVKVPADKTASVANRPTFFGNDVSAAEIPRVGFYTAKQAYYQGLMQNGIPGGAWFRHQAREAELALRGTITTTDPTNRPAWDSYRPFSNIDDTYSLMAGSRAVSENLQLDRVLPAARADDTIVKLDTIKGVTVKEIDWKPYLKDKNPALDPLAAYVPADQHVVFFPTFESMIRLSDEADRQGTPLVQAAEPQSQDVKVIDRYQRQIGLRTTMVGRMLGPQVIKSVALTGGDAYFRIGTDAALLFEARDLAALRTMLVGQITLQTAGEQGVKKGSGELLGVSYESWQTDDRTVSSYLAAVGSSVVVANSLKQLQNIVETEQGKRPAIAGLDEYKFFRDRYQLGDAGETALLFLSDATIRRWCSPRWRIADSRRVRDLAVLSELQAANLEALAGRTVEPKVLRTDLRLSIAGDVDLTATGVRSTSVGGLDFMTPIGELEFDRVTKSEAEAYERWRDGYQRNFSWAFDPIALRFKVADDKLAADMTVMPLIDGSEYREYIAVSRGAKLKPTSGDPHGAVFHGALAFNRDSQRVKELSSMASMWVPALRVDPLGWMGQSISIYADDSPLWDKLAELKTDSDRQKFVRENGYQFPVAINFEVASAFKATAFLVAVRGFIDQVGPGMTAWETLNHGEYSYVKIRPTEKAVRPGDPDEKLAIYYALTSDTLTLSPNEDLIKRSLDRHAARSAKSGDPKSSEKPAQASSEPRDAVADSIEWLGENLCLELGDRAIQAFATLSAQEYQYRMRTQSWSNLPALNEWKRLFPDQDPIALHERLWGAKLTCPGGGRYVWNDRWQTMESTAYGHPGEPKVGNDVPPQLRDFQGARFGLTFEEQGLRAKAELKRRK
jgi:hypothetical protein